MTASIPASTAPVAPYRVGELSIEDGLDIAMWRTPGPWAVQDSLQAPKSYEGYWAVRDARDVLIGYCCLGEDARPLGMDSSSALLDVALGLAPELTGRHLSRQFAEVVVGYAKGVAEGRRLRCTVASWNAVGRHTAEAVGFQVTGVHELRGSSQVTSYFVYET